MTPESAPSTLVRAHLAAAILAVAITASILAGWCRWSEMRERELAASLTAPGREAEMLSPAWQASALADPRALPLFGSSELELPRDLKNRAGVFFHEHPTGFEVAMIGKVGTYPLIMAQQFAALGTRLRGRKVVICISPSWFYFRDLIRSHYLGSFAVLPAMKLALSPQLTWQTKRELARRLLEYPEALRRTPVTAFALAQLASGSWPHRIAYWLAYPLGRMQMAVAEMQDRFDLQQRFSRATAGQPESPPANYAPLDWKALLAEAELAAGEPVRAGAIASSDDRPLRNDAGFLARVAQSNQWGDLELLLKVAKELGARPLLLCNPQNSLYAAEKGYSRQAREVVYHRLRELTRRYDVPLRDFAECDGDMRYLTGRFDHLSELGWLYYDQAIDDFFHDRLGPAGR